MSAQPIQSPAIKRRLCFAALDRTPFRWDSWGVRRSAALLLVRVVDMSYRAALDWVDKYRRERDV